MTLIGNLSKNVLRCFPKEKLHENRHFMSEYQKWREIIISMMLYTLNLDDFCQIQNSNCVYTMIFAQSTHLKQNLGGCGGNQSPCHIWFFVNKDIN